MRALQWTLTAMGPHHGCLGALDTLVPCQFCLIPLFFPHMGFQSVHGPLPCSHWNIPFLLQG